MPQLDKLTFFNQLFWSFLVFLVLYYVLASHVCPAIGRILKARSKLVAMRSKEQIEPTVLMQSGSNSNKAYNYRKITRAVMALNKLSVIKKVK